MNTVINENGEALKDQYERAVAAENRVALLEHLVAVQDKLIKAEHAIGVYFTKLVLSYNDVLTQKQKKKVEQYTHEVYMTQLLEDVLKARADLQNLRAGMAMEGEVRGVENA